MNDLLKTRSGSKRSVLAFGVAPLVGTYAYCLLLTCSLMWNSPRLPDGALTELATLPLMLVVGTITIAYSGIALFGVPAWLALRKLRAEGLLPYALVGAVGGLLMPLVNSAARFVATGGLHHLPIAGTFVLGTFWLVAKERAAS